MNNNRPLVLIVDDDPLCISLLEEILYANNYETLKAFSGKEALSILDQHPNIDLIVLDVIMPGIDGFEVCALIKKNIAYKNIPIIFLTGLIDDKSQLKAFEAGGVDFINKPLKKEVINARINTQLNLKTNMDHLNILLTDKQKLIKALNKALSISVFAFICAGLFLFIIGVILWVLYI